jgi:predicted RNase H-like nuclease (RuvC/YqgF family)
MECRKVYFVDEKFALEYIDKLNKTSSREIKPVRAYLCEKCLCWHLTSIESKENRRIGHLGRQINNLKAKISHLQNENEILKSKLNKRAKRT